jgi:hypothetical protein
LLGEPLISDFAAPEFASRFRPYSKVIRT